MVEKTNALKKKRVLISEVTTSEELKQFGNFTKEFGYPHHPD